MWVAEHLQWFAKILVPSGTPAEVMIIRFQLVWLALAPSQPPEEARSALFLLHHSRGAQIAKIKYLIAIHGVLLCPFLGNLRQERHQVNLITLVVLGVMRHFRHRGFCQNYATRHAEISCEKKFFIRRSDEDRISRVSHLIADLMISPSSMLNKM